VVERTHGWIGRCRRHSLDYDTYTSSSVAMIQLTSIGAMLRRLAPKENQPVFKHCIASQTHRKKSGKLFR